ncbi:hypothetical protein D3C74_430570 [compost metagenome]
MLGIMALGLFLCHLYQLPCHQLKSFVFQTADNTADQTTLHTIRLHHQKCTIHCQFTPHSRFKVNHYVNAIPLIVTYMSKSSQ